MKKLLLCLPLLLVLLCLPVRAAEQELRGVWVSTVYNLDYPSAPGLSAGQLENEARAIVEQAKRWGLNAIFLQVRPCGDALYPSELQPWSAVLSGEQGQAPAGGFDPLACFVELCHQNGLELHAWLNPYRLTRTAAADREAALAQLCDTHPARDLSDCVVYHSDGCLYLDPGRPEVQAHLLAAAEEILQNYAVDGIHLDDYFYPGNTFPDEETFAQYGGGFATPGDFRRDAVNRLVSGLHELAGRYGAVFGVSPSGIWATAAHKEQGVETHGSESYFEQFADSRKWVREGMVDYILPQIYWEIGADSGEFRTVLRWWEEAVSGTQVRLYVGLAAYKSAEAAEGSLWQGCDELERQLALLREGAAAGFSLFRYGSVGQVPGLTELLSAGAEQAPTRVSLHPETLEINVPAAGQSVLVGETIPFSCTAPRASRVTVFYGSGYTALKSDLNGGFTGRIPSETPQDEGAFTAPALVCAEKHGILTVKLTPFTITTLEDADEGSVEEVRLSEAGDWHQVTFFTGTSLPAVLQREGDVLQLTLSPCQTAPVFSDEAFATVDIQQQGNTARYRLVLPDDGQSRQFQLLWEPEKITLRVRRTPPDPSEADR